ncbi:hypothetical protein ERJ75_000677900 [Trypanosoma vivax]|uniref:Uncharacterized protein n=1 Tax=Trypanosoma vivax (strain Y486) TaxID=1055687 RepID=G0U5J1_TRYVY|nr:hypothetical protein TRVL_06019 [Trypanosoma vivax]KAH8614542.1 hypothetical protein ERJ75_000677900 [Trypanosoma vivax]CCC51142.1 conserved hypothetical protein [Trypanosoma vivax Y486]
MADRDVLYMGCVVVSLTEVRVGGALLLDEPDSCIGFRVCAAVVSTGKGVEESLGESASSSLYPLRNGGINEQLAVPVLLECVPTSSSTEGGKRGKRDSAEPRPKRGQSLTESGFGAVGVELILDVILVRGKEESKAARRRVAVESLYDIASQHCGVGVARVSVDILRASGLWDDSASQVNPRANGGSGRNWSGLGVHFVVRAVDMSEPARIMMNAEVEASTILGLPHLRSSTRFPVPLQHRMPYSAFPLDVVYTFYCRLYGHLFGKPMKPSSHVIQLLRKAWVEGKFYTANDTVYDDFFDVNRVRRVVNHVETVEGRWNAVRTVDISRVILNEDMLAPLLATLFYCTSLCTLVLDQNTLSDVTCYRVAALFYRHRYLQEILVLGNSVHEGGGEQLLRLARRNKRLTRLVITGSFCSPPLLQRIQRVVKMNSDSMAEDPFNVFSASYSYAKGPMSLPDSIVRQGLAVWAMLSVAPLQTVSANCVLNSTFGVEETSSLDHTPSSEGGGDSKKQRKSGVEVDERGQGLSVVPDCAFSPLLNEVMRTVALRMSSKVHDPWVCQVFSDIESLLGCSRGTRGDAPDEKRRTKEREGKHPQLSHQMLEGVYTISFLRLVVVTMRALEHMVDWEEAVAVLRGIGQKQTSLGIMKEDYCDAVKAFIQALTLVCGKDETDAIHSAAFIQCLALGIRTALEVV